MAKQIINVGTSPNDGSGDTLRDGGVKLNANYTELYTALGGDTVKIAIPAAPSNGQILKYNSSNSVFEPAADNNTDTTYSHSVEDAGGAIVLRLQEDAAGVITNDDITIAVGAGLTVARTDADTLTLVNTVQNTTYSISVESIIAGSQTLRLTGSNASIDDTLFTGGSGIDITSSGPGNMTVNADVVSVNGAIGAVKTYPTFTIASQNGTNFTVGGAGTDPGGEPDPQLFCYRGFTYRFINNSDVTVRIQQFAGGAYPASFISSTGASAAEAAPGEEVTFTIPMSASTGSTYAYACPTDTDLGNVITVV
jgi:hypothetical protein